jgi:hypothetical protein
MARRFWVPIAATLVTTAGAAASLAVAFLDRAYYENETLLVPFGPEEAGSVVITRELDDPLPWLAAGIAFAGAAALCLVLAVRARPAANV